MTSIFLLKRACLATVSACIIGTSGCASLSDAEGRSYGEPVPQSWSEYASEGQVEARWWESFADPRLDALVIKALGESPSIGQAEARLAQARAQVVIAGADRLPQLGGQFSASKQKQSLSGFGPLAGGQTGGITAFTTENYGLNLNVNWEIDLWGRLAALDEAARQDFLGSVQGLRTTRQSVAAQIAKAYFAVIEAEQQVELSTKTVEAYTETAREIGNRADIGLIAPNDKLLAQATLESARGGLLQRQDSLQRARRRLQILTRIYPTGELTTFGSLPAVPSFPAAGLPASLFTRRPDILAS